MVVDCCCSCGELLLNYLVVESCCVVAVFESPLLDNVAEGCLVAFVGIK